MFRYSIKISGIVQGIGYRYFVLNKAKKLGITGWVRNLDTGGVEINAEGPEKQMEDFVDAIRTQHPWAQIKGIELEKSEIKIKTYDDFSITL